MQNFAQAVLKPKRLLLHFVIVNLVVGVFIAKDYGASPDEGWEFLFSSVAYDRCTNPLDAYPLEA